MVECQEATVYEMSRTSVRSDCLHVSRRFVGYLLDVLDLHVVATLILHPQVM